MSRERTESVEAVGKSETKSRQAAPETAGSPVGDSHGYIKAKDKERLQNRLRRIEGQVRGLQRMVEDEKYCIDVLTQVSAATKALESVALTLLHDHLTHCVVDAARQGGPDADRKVREASDAIARLVRS